MTDEQWKELNFNPRYSVSNYGRIRNNKTGRILKPRYHTTEGYSRVSIGGKEYRTHRLVAEAFLPTNPDPIRFNQVNHINGNKKDNYYSNLEWCDNSLNQKHAYAIGLQMNRGGDGNGRCKIRDIEVIDIWNNNLTVDYIVERFGVTSKYAKRLINKQVRRYLLAE